MELAISEASTAALYDAVIEFLSFHSFGEALQAFQAERALKRKTLEKSTKALPLTGKARTTVISEMLARFDNGNAADFFAMWQRFIPVSFQRSDEWTAKLEFGLQVHFAIWPMLPCATQPPRREDMAKRMQAFKHYLETRGATLARQGAFLAYYALPYVPEPEAHPSFSHLFDPECMVQQRTQLETFLQSVPSEVTTPKLYFMYNAFTSGGSVHLPPKATADAPPGAGNALLDGTETLDAYLSDSATLGASAASAGASDPLDRSTLHANGGWAAGSGGLSAITEGSHEFETLHSAAMSEVPGARRSSDARAPQDERARALGTTSEETPNAQSSSASVDQAGALGSVQSFGREAGADDTCRVQMSDSPTPDTAGPDQKGREDQEISASKDGQVLRSVELGNVTRTIVQDALLPAVNWSIVKEHLANGDHSLTARLLQAVRWRLTKSPAGLRRRQVLATIVEADLLSCIEPCAKGGDLVTALSGEADTRVHEELARLVNAIASDPAGRAYLLLSGDAVTSALLKLFRETPQAKLTRTEGDETIDTPLHQQALAALQKMSLRRSVQSHLLSSDQLPWLIEVLQTPDSLSEHSIEYGMALLMNLCLRSKGRRACESLPVLDVLDLLIQAPNPQVRTYVHGTLYSILSRPAIVEQAQQRGLSEMLLAISESSPPVFQRQISYILAKLDEVAEGAAPEASDEHDDGGSVDGDDTNDDYEDDVEYDDEDVSEVLLGSAGSNALIGEPLLCSEFLASVEDAREEQASVRESMVLAGSTTTLRSGSLPRPDTGGQLRSIKTRRDSVRSPQGSPSPSRSVPEGADVFARPVTPHRSAGSSGLVPQASRDEGPSGLAHSFSEARGSGSMRRHDASISASASGLRASDDQSLTMRARAERAAAQVSKSKDSAQAQQKSQEYVSVFGPRRELPRTPNVHS